MNEMPAASTAIRLFDLLILLSACFAVHAAHADSNLLQRGAGAAAGVFAGIYVHELGHAAALSASGAQNIQIAVPGPDCALLCGQTNATWASAPRPADMRMVDASGFLSSNLAAEAILRHQGAARSAFGQGYTATNLYSNVSHVVTITPGSAGETATAATISTISNSPAGTRICCRRV